MLSPSGPAKNSGKIVTTLIVSGNSSLQEAERVVDQDFPSADIDPGQDFGPIWNEDAASRCIHVEHYALR
jgi:hypothetical protein